jgi:formylglycine-generating enzyme required for sulfatase activity
LTAPDEQALKAGDSFRECLPKQQGKDYCPDMTVVPAGSFTMGSPSTEMNSFNVERPQHSVAIATPFAVSKYELTFDEWDSCADDGDCAWRPNESGWKRGQQPVIYVSWEDAQRYVAWLAKATGKAYRLLSEAEYEYAARAGTTTAYPWGDDFKLNGKAMAVCADCGSKWDNSQTAPVGSFPPNKFGLYDMVGNVLEWTADCVHINYNNAPTDSSAWLADTDGDCTNRVVRGGSWDNNADGLRSAGRYKNAIGMRGVNLGFRVARTLP